SYSVGKNEQYTDNLVYSDAISLFIAAFKERFEDNPIQAIRFQHIIETGHCPFRLKDAQPVSV
ncbi:MAG: hypothetical protein AAF153_03120, partial [Pseudomonadota bacterium]